MGGDNDENNERGSDRFPLWKLQDPNLDYLNLPDMTLEEFDQEFPDFEEQSGDWELVEDPCGSVCSGVPAVFC
ncbi:MAG: hypothetical protein M3Y72_13130 [Acidobacteriota bacterium]|nr:hypothetical protein [Acidobacteriota bacterium]